MGQLEGAVPRIQATLSGHRADLQRPGVRRHGGGVEKMRRRPQADTAYYFAASAVDAARKDLVAPFRPVGFEQLPEVFREAEGRWFTVHAEHRFPGQPQARRPCSRGWADLLKPEYRNAVTYLDPRSTGVGQVLTFAAAYGNGGDEDNVRRAPTTSAACMQRAMCSGWRHHALRQVPEGRDPGLDRLRKRWPESPARGRDGRRLRNRDPQ